MFRFLLILSLITCTSFASEVRIDASSPEKLQTSYAKMVTSLDDEMQQKFVLAMTTISVVMAQRPDLGGTQKAMEMINGKTADEIIAESRKLTGYIRRGQTILNASTSKEFSKSVGNMLVSLPDNKREKFSEAIAKLMFERERLDTPEKDFLKKLNGKTADEIIEIAKKIDVPFDILNRREEKKYDVEKLSDTELEKLGIKRKTNKDKKNDTLEFSNSLVPPSN